MEVYYETISMAIAEFEKEGFDAEFRIDNDKVCIGDICWNPEKIKIVKIGRYEGNTDPGDEAVIYGMETENGKKGWFLSSFGVYADSGVEAILEKIKISG
jgi:hypothetical protein